MTAPLTIDQATCRLLLEKLGPSLGLWRAAEVAVLRRALTAPSRPVLDVGCGDGLVTALVLSSVEVGLDPNRQALAQARTRGVYGQLAPWTVQAAPLAAGSMGTLLSNSVLEHIPDLEVALAAAARLLRPGGFFVFTTPTAAFSRWLTLPLARYAGWRNRHLAHRNLWTLPRWEQQLDRVGLTLVRSATYLRPQLVWLWDLLELLQQVWIGQRRLFSLFWRRLSPLTLERLAYRLSQLDLGAAAAGGGRLIVARKGGRDG